MGWYENRGQVTGTAFATRRMVSRAVGLAMLNAKFEDYLNDRVFTRYIQRSVSAPIRDYLVGLGVPRARVDARTKQLLPTLAPTILMRSQGLSHQLGFKSCQKIQQLYGARQVQAIRRLYQEAKLRAVRR